MQLRSALLLVASIATTVGEASGQSGRELVARLGCASCHGELAPAGTRAAPDLALSAARSHPGFLEAFLTAPRKVHADTRMPDVLAGRSRAERVDAAASLAAYVRSLAPVDDGFDVASDWKRGERLYHQVGCVQCHGPRAADAVTGSVGPMPAGGRALDHVAAKYTARGLAAFLHDPLAHRPAGLMPEMHLSRAEAGDLAAYLVPGDEVGESLSPRPTASTPERVAAGRELYEELRCASCHGSAAGETPPAADVPFRSGVDGCAGDAPPPGAPAYGRTDAERATIRAAIAALDEPLAPADRIEHTLEAFRCTACHERGGRGGVPMELDGYLVSDEPELGDNARRPPHLDGVGGKLRRTWLENVLHDGASVRPYMRTRMPVFGAENVSHLAALLEEVDATEEPLVFPKPSRETERESRDAARLLLGTTRLGCVSCHAFNAKRGPSFQGLDLITSPERLRERWFRDFLIAPQSRLPGVVMPESWPGGVAVDDETLGGDTDAQIGAIWHFLTLGRSAPNPRGIDQPRWDVDVEGAPRVYRGRSRVAGFRGVAVGFPEGLHYAFDANNGALAALWRGDFVSVNWNGQGAGDFNPRARAVELARDVALLEGVERDAPWPLKPVKTEEEPVNPDPTYPRQYGYRFRGYQLAADGVPTLRYSMSAVDVSDRAVPEVEPADQGGPARLVRTLTFEAAAPTELIFRALAGELEALDDGAHRSGRVTVRIAGHTPRLRAFDGGQELLVDLTLPAGRTEMEIRYDLAD